MARGHRKKKAGGKRRMGAASRSGKGNLLQMGLGVLVGIAGTAYLSKKVLSTTSSTVKGGGAVALGALGAWKLKTHPVVTGIALGMAGYGGATLIDGFTKAGITGMGCGDGMSGFRDVAQIAGTVEQQQARIRKFPNPAGIGNPRTRRAGILAQG